MSSFSCSSVMKLTVDLYMFDEMTQHDIRLVRKIFCSNLISILAFGILCFSTVRRKFGFQLE